MNETKESLQQRWKIIKAAINAENEIQKCTHCQPLKKLDKSAMWVIIGLIVLTHAFFTFWLSTTINGYHNNSFLILSSYGIIEIFASLYCFKKSEKWTYQK